MDTPARDPTTAPDATRPGSKRSPGKKLSLRGQALAYLSRREYSRQELRRKLLEATRRQRPSARRSRDDGEVDESADAEARVDAIERALALDGPFADPAAVAAALPPTPPTPPTEAEVDEVLDWMASKGYLSDERFVESRLHARSQRHGSLRIRQELSRHGVEMTPEQTARLRDTEAERAREVWRRKFGTVATDPKERARQARFLAARGFPADIVRRIVGGDDD